jgi:hypothetical protein
MDEKEIVVRRMRNSGLSGPPAKDWREVLRRFGAMQAQDYGPAKWSLGDRSRGVTNDDLDRALHKGTLLRTHVLRPTWHFVRPEDIRWLLELTGPRVHAGNSRPYRELGMDEAFTSKSNKLIARALRGGNQLTRKELQDVLSMGGVDTSSRRVGYVMMYAELEGLICSGGLNGKHHTYALLEERAPDAKRLSPDEALAELTLRYFTTHGPATVHDFRWWSSLKVSDIRRGLDLVASQLRNEVVDGKAYWFSGRAPRSRPKAPVVHLLQAYDEYVVGYSETKRLLNLSGTARRLSDRTLYLGVAVLDGQIAGHWKRTVSKRSLRFDVALYRPFKGARAAALERAADAHGAFLGLPAEVATTRLQP